MKNYDKHHQESQESQPIEEYPEESSYPEMNHNNHFKMYEFSSL